VKEIICGGGFIFVAKTILSLLTRKSDLD